MRTVKIEALVVAGIAGFAFGAAGEPVELEPSVGAVRHAGHIYYNIGTGEKITTLIEAGDAQRPVDGGVWGEIWIATTGAQCADFGYSSEYFFGLSVGSACSATRCDWNQILFDWGDIATDTVVDCVQVHWISDHEDTDTDSDSLADGVVGFAAEWIYWDAFTGRPVDFQSLSLPLVSFSFYSLPGEYPVDTATVAYWTADIDLGATFGTSLTFEIGDTDGDPQGAAVHHPNLDDQDLDSDSIPDVDPDEDGLADWGWSIQFVQPGRVDVDNADSDSDSLTGIDGDLANEATAGVIFGSPTPGHAEFDTAEGLWVWVSDGPTAGETEDLFTLGSNTTTHNFGFDTVSGPFWFGGLDCSPGQTDGYTPAAHFQTILYQDSPPLDCPADTNGDGVLDFFDVSFFFIISPDYNGDTVFDYFDVSIFIQMFLSKCEYCPPCLP